MHIDVIYFSLKAHRKLNVVISGHTVIFFVVFFVFMKIRKSYSVDNKKKG